MIRLEGGVLVLDAPISKEDAQAVQEFAKHVREQEQERIIKLLDARVTNLRKCLGDDCDCIKDARIIDYAIELIKGETK